ncbi:MAG: hypothetical protein H6713_38735 [Myxococcales bacterium]|nr:hypothetical protein [Myxococcales bacterium]
MTLAPRNVRVAKPEARSRLAGLDPLGERLQPARVERLVFTCPIDRAGRIGRAEHDVLAVGEQVENSGERAASTWRRAAA